MRVYTHTYVYIYIYIYMPPRGPPMMRTVSIAILYQNIQIIIAATTVATIIIH